jgi:phosphatidylserine/phosphatidylglycerophosphate/cardiolipin synthase-like enzyme
MAHLMPPSDSISPYFLAQGEQSPIVTASRLADFLDCAQQSLDIAVYDFRLGEPLKEIVAGALARGAARGVAIRIAYDSDKPETPQLDRGMDPASSGTGALVRSLGYPYRRIGGLKLMHHKYVVRDAGTPWAAVWTGSTNLTDDSWTLQENNTVVLESPELAASYHEDFEDLWSSRVIEDSGSFDPPSAMLRYGDALATIHLLFSPGRGPAIDFDVAVHVARARRRVRICSMLLNSGALLAALGDQLHLGRVAIDGIYDQTQMEDVLVQWQHVPHNHWKIGAVHNVVERAHLVGKRSTRYSPTSPHDFMHNKILVVDDTVITGSYNFSRSAELNAENILLIESAALAETYSRYIDHLIAKYG